VGGGGSMYGNQHGDSLFFGGRDGRGTISGGCKYQTGIANTILGSVSIAAT
jgi:hypothetical protein